ncbi:MAG: septum formation inhibitor Maf [Cryomorphaceae bacterium]|nr:septum formation inhibitor Maf [Flavobacteriales bacterium]
MNNILSTIFVLLVLTACEAQVEPNTQPSAEVQQPENFGDYWYAGEAEIAKYNLTQSRYGQERRGDAVLIFVTEDFLPEKQVKKEFGEKEGISVLKLNKLKKFVTGIYDYSIMTSVFTPIDYRVYPATMKTTFSSQDWCGQSMGQMNLRSGKLQYQVRSYFQAEGDKDISLDATYIEEDVWTRIRLEPQMLPRGEIDMVPSQEYLRLHHRELKPYKAKASLVLQVNDDKAENREFYIYKITYPELDRTLEIICESEFPFEILEWSETLSGKEEKEVTTATLSTKIRAPYWEYNSNENKALRDSLGLVFDLK